MVSSLVSMMYNEIGARSAVTPLVTLLGHGGFQLFIGGTQARWMVLFGKIHLQMDDWGYSTSWKCANSSAAAKHGASILTLNVESRMIAIRTKQAIWLGPEIWRNDIQKFCLRLAQNDHQVAGSQLFRHSGLVMPKIFQ